VTTVTEKEALQIVKSAWNYRESYHLTDLGNAERLVSLHGQELRYCHPWSRWLVWDGRRWKIDDTAEVKRRAKEVIRLMYAEASNIEDKTDRQALVNFAMKSEQNARITPWWSWQLVKKAYRFCPGPGHRPLAAKCG